ncbi:4339_t:CDS:1, partial [Diversispora eburnea]
MIKVVKIILGKRSRKLLIRFVVRPFINSRLNKIKKQYQKIKRILMRASYEIVVEITIISCFETMKSLVWTYHSIIELGLMILMISSVTYSRYPAELPISYHPELPIYHPEQKLITKLPISYHPEQKLINELPISYHPEQKLINELQISYHPEQKLFTADIWTIHLALDND